MSDMKRVVSIVVVTLLFYSCSSRRAQMRTDVEVDVARLQTVESRQVDTSWAEKLEKMALTLAKHDNYTSTTTETIYSLPDSTGVQYKVAERKQVVKGNGRTVIESKKNKIAGKGGMKQSEGRENDNHIEKTSIDSKEAVIVDTRSPIGVYVIIGIIVLTGVYFLWRRIKRYIH